METRLEIVPQANLLDEVHFILYQWANNGDFEKLREKFADHFSEEMGNNNRKLDMINEMYYYVIEHMKNRKEKIDYYYKERNSQLSIFLGLALLWDMRNYTSEIPSFQDRIASISPERRIKEFAMNINGEEAANTSDEELSTFSDLITFIENSSYDQASKWEAVKIFNNQEFYYNEVSSILTEAMGLLKDKYAGQLEELSKEFYEYWSGYQKEKDIIDTINENMKISWRMSEKGAVLIPAVFMPLSISISLDDIENRSPDIIRLGILQDKRLELTDHNIKKEDIVEIGKILSDKSKVDILEFVSKKPCYGKEIANELNLSTATISYHVNALLKLSFLQAEVISNKVYYSLDRDKIAKYLDDMKGFFTKL